MRPVFNLVIILGAGLCFMAGYTVGKKHGYRTAPPAAPVLLESEATSLVETELPLVAEINRELPDPAPVEIETPDPERFSQRAEGSVITLTDTKERSLQGELITATEYHLKIRRQYDGRVVEVPIAMLSQEDQAFAAYLLKSKNASNQPDPMSEADKIWDEIFKNM